MMLFKVGYCCPMHVPTIPNDDHRATIATMQMLKQPDQVIAVNVLGLQMKIE